MSGTGAMSMSLVAVVTARWFVKSRTNRARIGAFFAGFGILRLIALIPGVGLVAWFVVCVYGIGAVSMAAWYGGHRVLPRTDSATDSAEIATESPTDSAPDLAPGSTESPS